MRGRVGGEDQILKLSNNEKNRVINITKMMQHWKQKFYRYKNQNDDDDDDDDDKKWKKRL